MNRRFASNGATARRGPTLLAAAVILLLGVAAILPGCPFGGCGECVRAVNCVEKCGGPVIQSGCCDCPSGTFDDFDCTDGGQDCGECFRAVNCVETCGGPSVQSGCCPCPAGSFDDLGCMDAGADSGDGG
jgi:hypothetical protein